jgi:hypothetical protein
LPFALNKFILSPGLLLRARLLMGTRLLMVKKYVPEQFTLRLRFERRDQSRGKDGTMTPFSC